MDQNHTHESVGITPGGMPIQRCPQVPPDMVKVMYAPEFPDGVLLIGRDVDLPALLFDLSQTAEDREWLRGIKVGA